MKTAVLRWTEQAKTMTVQRSSPKPAYSCGPCDLAAYSAGTSPKKSRPESGDRTHGKWYTQQADQDGKHEQQNQGQTQLTAENHETT